MFAINYCFVTFILSDVFLAPILKWRVEVSGARVQMNCVEPNVNREICISDTLESRRLAPAVTFHRNIQTLSTLRVFMNHVPGVCLIQHTRLSAHVVHFFSKTWSCRNRMTTPIELLQNVWFKLFYVRFLCSYAFKWK